MNDVTTPAGVAELRRNSALHFHRFLVSESLDRFLSQLKAPADEIELETAFHACRLSGKKLPASQYAFQENAFRTNYEFYFQDLKRLTYLSLLMNISHEWDKRIRIFILADMDRPREQPDIHRKVWKSNFFALCDLLEALGTDFRAHPSFEKIKICHDIVNVHKHGEGESYVNLLHSHPEYLTVGRNSDYKTDVSMINYELAITHGQFLEFANAIESFWLDLPAPIQIGQHSTLPEWLSDYRFSPSIKNESFP